MSKLNNKLLLYNNSIKKIYLYYRENYIYIDYTQYSDYNLRATIKYYNYNYKIYI